MSHHTHAFCSSVSGRVVDGNAYTMSRVARLVFVVYHGYTRSVAALGIDAVVLSSSRPSLTISNHHEVSHRIDTFL